MRGVYFILQTLQSMNIVMTDKVGRVSWLSDQRKPVKKMTEFVSTENQNYR